MIIFWLAFAVGLTVLGAILALVTQDAQEEHDRALEEILHP